MYRRLVSLIPGGNRWRGGGDRATAGPDVGSTNVGCDFGGLGVVVPEAQTSGQLIDLVCWGSPQAGVR